MTGKAGKTHASRQAKVQPAKGFFRKREPSLTTEEFATI